MANSTTFTLQYDIKDAEANLRKLQTFNKQTYSELDKSTQQLNGTLQIHEAQLKEISSGQEKLNTQIKRLNARRNEAGKLTKEENTELKKLEATYREMTKEATRLRTAHRSETASLKNKISAQKEVLRDSKDQITYTEQEVKGINKRINAEKRLRSEISKRLSDATKAVGVTSISGAKVGKTNEQKRLSEYYIALEKKTNRKIIKDKFARYQKEKELRAKNSADARKALKERLELTRKEARATDKRVQAQERLQNQVKKGEAVRNNQLNAFVRHIRQLETMVVLYYSLTRAYRSTIGIGMELNKVVEQNSYGLAALIASNTDLVKNGKIVIDNEKQFAMALEFSQKTMLKLKDAALQTVATFPELTQIFQQAIGYSLKMGDAMGKSTEQITDRTIEIAQSMSNMGGAIGMNSDLVLEEIRSIFSGDVTRDSKLGILLFGNPSEANKAIKAAGNDVDAFYNLMSDKLEKFRRLGGVDAFFINVQKLKGEYENLWKDISKPLFDDVNDSMVELTKMIRENKDEITEWGKSFYDGVKFVSEYADELALLAGGYIAYKGVVIAATGVTAAFNAVLTKNPIIFAAQALATTGALAYTFYDDIRDILEENFNVELNGLREVLGLEKKILNTKSASIKLTTDQSRLKTLQEEAKLLSQIELDSLFDKNITDEARQQVHDYVVFVNNEIAKLQKGIAETTAEELGFSLEGKVKPKAIDKKEWKEFLKWLDDEMEKSFSKSMMQDAADSAMITDLVAAGEALKKASQDGLEISEEDKKLLEQLGISLKEEFVDAGQIVGNTVASTMADAITTAMQKGSIDIKEAVSAGATSIGSGLIAGGTGVLAQQMAMTSLGPYGAIAAGAGAVAFGSMLGGKKEVQEISLSDLSKDVYDKQIKAIEENTSAINLQGKEGTGIAENISKIQDLIFSAQTAKEVIDQFEFQTIYSKDFVGGQLTFIEATSKKNAEAIVAQLKEIGLETAYYTPGGGVSRVAVSSDQLGEIASIKDYQKQLGTVVLESRSTILSMANSFATAETEIALLDEAAKALGLTSKDDKEGFNQLIGSMQADTIELNKLNIALKKATDEDSIDKITEQIGALFEAGDPLIMAQDFNEEISLLSENFGEATDGTNDLVDSLGNYNSGLADQLSIFESASSVFYNVRTQAQSAIDNITGILETPAESVNTLMERYRSERGDVQTAQSAIFTETGELKEGATQEDIDTYNREASEFFDIASRATSTIQEVYASSKPELLTEIRGDMEATRDLAKDAEDYYREQVSNQKIIIELLAELKSVIAEGNGLSEEQLSAIEKQTGFTEAIASTTSRTTEEIVADIKAADG